MQAIQTKYIAPTNTKCSRIKATAEAGNITVSWDYSLSIEENHTAAAQALCDKLSWSESTRGKLITGALVNGYCHVFTGRV